MLVIYLREWESHWKVSSKLMYFTLIPVCVGESNSILGILVSLYVPQGEQNFWLSLSANKCQNPCSGPPSV